MLVEFTGKRGCFWLGNQSGFTKEAACVREQGQHLEDRPRTGKTQKRELRGQRPRGGEGQMVKGNSRYFTLAYIKSKTNPTTGSA